MCRTGLVDALNCHLPIALIVIVQDFFDLRLRKVRSWKTDSRVGSVLALDNENLLLCAEHAVLFCDLREDRRDVFIYGQATLRILLDWKVFVKTKTLTFV
jgi:hypothetical protein